MSKLLSVAVLAAVVAVTGSLRADEAKKADPTGTWKWSFTNPNNSSQSRETVLKLKLDGEKLSGTISGRNNTEIDIQDATFKDNEVAFTVTRERNNQKFTMKYKGKLDGDTIKGTTEFERQGQTRSREWEAKRSS